MTTDGSPTRISVTTLGAAAAHFLARHRSARVAAVFERSLYLEEAGDFLCLGVGIGNGPLNAVADGGAAVRAIALFATGQRVGISKGVLSGEHVRFAFGDAAIWKPPLWPQRSDPAGGVAALGLVAEIAERDAPCEGLSRLLLLGARPTGPAGSLPCDAKGNACAIADFALPRIERLIDWLAGAVVTEASGAASRTPPSGLLGLGPGLTPSGDDVLCGALIALHAIGADLAAGELAGAIRDAAPRATSPLSAAFIAEAAEGQGSEALHNFLCAAIEADAVSMRQSMRALIAIGHTSGWDGMAGAVLVLRAAAAADRDPRSP